jgi:hypothetical protein
VSKGAEPVADVTVPADAKTNPQWIPRRRPDLAEVAAQTVPMRRFIARIGLALPVLFILATVAVSSALGQPLRGSVDLRELGLWAAGTVVLLVPYAAALVVMCHARRGGLIWTTALVYTGLSGLLGLGVEMSVFGGDSSTATFSLISVFVVQVVVLAPMCAAVAFLVGIMRNSTRR